MVAASSNRIAWTYHADNGTAYRVAAVKDMTDQGSQGGEADDGTQPAKPANVKMRRITVTSAAGVSRVIPVYATDASILAENATINVNILGTIQPAAKQGYAGIDEAAA